MEYVEGLPIDRYCDEHDLSVAQRCLLIDKVCDAVAYAHRSLVVHRDLKPTNILITPDGNPKLLDFGIAKLIAGSDEETGDETLTRGPSQPQTPRYASPEQKRGDAVGTATDVYSLGLVLYELLAGQRPAEPIKASTAALIMGKEPRWSKRLRGDLDNILCMALRPESPLSDRGADAGGPAEASGRAAGDSAQGNLVLPLRQVFPSPPGWRVGGGADRRGGRGECGDHRARGAQSGAAARADGETRQQRAVQRAWIDRALAWSNAGPFGDREDNGRIPGSAGRGERRRRAGAFGAGFGIRARGESAGQPAAAESGDQRGAEASYVKAGNILDSLMAAGNDSADLRVKDAELRTEYGALLAETGRQDYALAQYRRSLEQVQIVLARDPHNLEARKSNSRIHIEIGQVTKYRDAAGTRRTETELLPVYEALAREYPRDTDCLLDLASIWSQIGSTFEEEAKPAEPTGAFRESASLREQVSALSLQDVSAQHDLLIAYGHLGDLTGSPMFPSLGDYREGVVWYRKAAAIAQKMRRRIVRTRRRGTTRGRRCCGSGHRRRRLEKTARRWRASGRRKGFWLRCARPLPQAFSWRDAWR
jgi:hypothetical protein